MVGLRLVTGYRALLAPAVFLLAVTVAVVVVHATRHHPAPAPVVRSHRVRPPTAGKPATARLYRVVPGDTLVGIAAKTHVPYARLRALNPSLRPTALFIGEKIRLR